MDVAAVSRGLPPGVWVGNGKSVPTGGRGAPGGGCARPVGFHAERGGRLARRRRVSVARQSCGSAVLRACSTGRRIRNGGGGGQNRSAREQDGACHRYARFRDGSRVFERGEARARTTARFRPARRITQRSPA